jgi:hypothetical protein
VVERQMVQVAQREAIIGCPSCGIAVYGASAPLSSQSVCGARDDHDTGYLCGRPAYHTGWHRAYVHLGRTYHALCGHPHMFGSWL